MDRRAFVTMVGGSIFAVALADEARPAGKVPRVGYLFYGSPDPRERSTPSGKGCASSDTSRVRASPSSIGSRAGRLSDTRGWPPSLSA